MQVAFYKADEGRLCGWVATPLRRKPFRGTTMASGRDLPHDVGQFVVEKVLGLEWGFWGLLAKGASFKSVPGRRPTNACCRRGAPFGLAGSRGARSPNDESSGQSTARLELPR
jgi:hypothetical protein